MMRQRRPNGIRNGIKMEQGSERWTRGKEEGGGALLVCSKWAINLDGDAFNLA